MSVPVKYKERSIAMFKMYLDGKSYREIGDHYGISREAVFGIAKRSDWKAMRAGYFQKIYDFAISTGAKRAGTKVLGILEEYVNRIERKLKRSPDEDISIDIIREIRQIAEMLIKENRLTDNKPTQSTTGIVRHEIILPRGVSELGVDPPGPNVKLVTAEIVDPDAKEAAFDIDSLGD